MISRAFKLRFRRRLRLRKLQVEELGQQAEEQLERNFFRRLERLYSVRRFVIDWIALVILLGGCVVAQTGALGAYYQQPQPVPGGTYSEGILGSFTNINPLYATSSVDTAVSKLLFAGLFTYDNNNNLVGALASNWSVSSNGIVYTVNLKPNLTWQDGKPLTAADVVFTYQMIQNPDANSPLASSFDGVKVQEVNPLTVTFTLPSPLSSFPYSLTNGIVPEHILSNEPAVALRTLPFDTTNPIGSGPFRFKGLEVTGDSPEDHEERIALVPFSRYYGGQPKLSEFDVIAFASQQDLLASFQDHQLTAIAGFTSVPSSIKSDSDLQAYNLPLTAAVMTFFKTSEGVLSDSNVRQALVQATNDPAIINNLPYPTLPVREPLLQGQLGYNSAYEEASYNPSAANNTLNADGWVMGSNGIRYKAGKPLTFSLYTQNNQEYTEVANELKLQWKAVGVDVNVVLQDSTEFQTTLSYHSYDALLYGIDIGKDPDVFVYWDSQFANVQSGDWLNFSEYSSSVADAALEEGRTRTDPSLRALEYQPFLQAWQSDAPAVGLYQPRYLYITHGMVYGLTEHPINTDIDRFDNVQNWMIRVKEVSQAK